jgi:hypothetical protein
MIAFDIEIELEDEEGDPEVASETPICPHAR